MARQQTLKQAFAAVGRKTTAPTRSMSQTTLNFDGCAPVLRNDSDVESDFSCDCGCVHNAEHIRYLNDAYECICDREGCDWKADPESCICRCCWDERVEDDRTLCLVRPGYFQFHQEDFLDEDMHKPGWDLSNLHYYEYTCKLRDLKQFVQQRGLKDPFPAGITLKHFYLSLLLAADGARVFRFMDLPAELRNEVYGYLLAPSLSEKHQAQILRTCKAVHEEAIEILYADNLISCEFINRPDYENQRIRLHNQWYRRNAALYTQLPSAIDMYPDFLARIRKIKIGITLDLGSWQSRHERNVNADFVRSGLLALSSMLMNSGRLRSLQVVIDVSDDSTIGPEVIASILYPLRRLRNVEAQFSAVNHGAAFTIPDSLRDDMVAEMRLQEPVFNTLKQCRLVLSEAEAYLSLVKMLDPVKDGAPRPSALRSANLTRHVKDLQSKMNRGRTLFADWLGEVKVQTRIAKIKELLAVISPDKIKSAMDDLTRATEQRDSDGIEHARCNIRDLARAKSPSPDPAPL